MSGQSWAQVVHELDPKRDEDPIVYEFSSAVEHTSDGIFKERSSHGVYDGDNG